ncbi:MAG: N-acetylmuramoyl-L-alanine amidase [Fimbriimonadaceae bacterium]|nr:N-acetylmuramoyl-L-alanine amidase [Fimbriimonadaceae bacterium]
MNRAAVVAVALAACPLAGASVGQAQWKDPGFNQVVWVDSPNQNKRPAGTVIDTIVLHHTSGPSLWSTVSWFKTDKSQVSAHFCVGRDGSIVQFLSTWDRAWHAGVSTDAFGRKGVNDFSVGIEIVNKGDGTEPYPEAQLRALDNLVAVLLRRFPQIKQITSHEFIAEPQGRKNDPINFPWERMRHFGLPLYYGLKPKK